VIPINIIQELPRKNYNDKNKSQTKYIKNNEKTDVLWTINKKVFKPTIIDNKNGLDKDIDEIRISLNKISNKNYDSQKNIIIERLSIFLDDHLSLKTIAQFIFDVASTNKFYSELYADLYLELVNKSPIFKDVLYSFVNLYKSTIDSITCVDANLDYDGFCQCTKANDKRRSMASFFMMVTKKGILEVDIMLEIIDHFQKVLFEYIEVEGKSPECEEISELLFIFISLGNDSILFNTSPLWSDHIIPKTILISKYKAKEHSSLTSRIIFKQLDLTDFLYR
jgi:hypothetical protein